MNSKSKTTASLLCYILSILGVHRFYLHKTLSGIPMPVTGSRQPHSWFPGVL